jgi:16S rRNA (cytidine1402-2'-O)-methyltransferase
MPSGKIHLIPSFLGNENVSLVCEDTKETVAQLNEFIVENAKSARHFLRAIGYKKNFDSEVIIHEMDKHAEKQDCGKLLENVMKGVSCGIISEAGNPCIADPGAEIVAYAHQHHIEVIPHIGASSILLALISSGFNGQQFSFHGYLPIKEPERSKKVKQLENSARSGNTQIFMETPFRNQKLLDEILKVCNDDTRLCIAGDLTLPGQFIKTMAVKAWKKAVPEINKRYCIFLFG